MPVFVLTGPDTVGCRARSDQLVRDNLSGSTPIERFDLTDDGGSSLASSACTASLFGGARVLLASPAGELTAQNAADLVEFALPDVTVVLTDTSALTPALRKALGGATLEHFSDPTPRDAAARVAAAAQAHGLRLDADAATHLATLAPTRWSLVQGALAELANLGTRDVDVPAVEQLTGTASAPATPWSLADAVEAGDLDRALRLAGRLDALPTIAYLSKRLSAVGRLLDSGITDLSAARDVAGSDSAARSALAASRRLSSDQVAAGWDLLAAADLEAKISGASRDVLTLLVVRLTAVWGRRPSAG